MRNLIIGETVTITTVGGIIGMVNAVPVANLVVGIVSLILLSILGTCMVGFLYIVHQNNAHARHEMTGIRTALQAIAANNGIHITNTTETNQAKVQTGDTAGNLVADVDAIRETGNG